MNMFGKFFGGDKPPAAEVKKVPTKTLGEKDASGYENERHFTEAEIIKTINVLVMKAGNIEATSQVESHDGVILSLYLRAEGSKTGYFYAIKGLYGKRGSTATVIDRVDYEAADSDEVEYSECLAQYDVVWVRQKGTY